MSYSWENASLSVKEGRLEELGKLYYQDPSSLPDIKSAKKELEALEESISRDLNDLGINRLTSTPAAVALQAVPVELPIERRRELVNLVTEFTDQLMPSSSGRVWGFAVGLIGAFMASNVSLLLMLAPGGATIKKGQFTTKEFTKVAPKALIRASRKSGPVGEFARRILERVPVIANRAVKDARPTASQVAFWCMLGAVEDAGAEYNQLLDVWRRRVEPPKSFLARQDEYNQALANFVSALDNGSVFDNGAGAFKEYITAQNQVPYLLSLDELIYDFYWLECAERWLWKENGQAHNPNVQQMRESIASLIQMMVVNGVDEIALSPAYPLFGWWSGLPSDVVNTLNVLAIQSESTREAFHALGFTDSETFQSVATMFAQNATKVGLTVLEKGFGSRGLMGLVGKLASTTLVRKTSPFLLRVEDINN